MTIQERTHMRRAATTTTARPRYKITRRDLSEQPTAVARAQVPADELGSWIGVAHHLVTRYLRRHGVKPAGPPFARVSVVDHTADVEAGFPVHQPIDGDGDVEPSTLPGGRAVVTTHLGRYEGLGYAYEALENWLARHGRTPAGPQWETYYTDPNAEPDSSRWRTDVVVPCERSTARRWRHR